MPQYRLCPIAAVDIRAGAVVGTDMVPFCLLVTEVHYGSDGSIGLSYLQGLTFDDPAEIAAGSIADLPDSTDLFLVTAGELWMQPGDNLSLLVAV